MNEQIIVTAYEVIDDGPKAFGHQSHVLAQMSDGEVLMVAVIAGMYFQKHHERALCVLRATGHVRQGLSVSRESVRY